MKTFFNKRQIFVIIISLLLGMFIGFLFFYDANSGSRKGLVQIDNQEATIWTCSMHPQIRQNEPGLCPICAMELVPVNAPGAADSENLGEIQMSEAAIKLAEIQTSTVRRGIPRRNINLFGRVKPNEKNISELTARFNGRIENLQVNFTGQTVRKGQLLGTIYSPELISAQQELLEAAKIKNSRPALYTAARTKLILWDISEQQIREIEERDKPIQYFQILSPISGTVTRRYISAGDYVEAGSPLFTVIDLTSIWVMFEAYENDLPWLNHGDSIEFRIQSFPGEMFQGKIIYIDPFINPETRIARVRVEVNNRSQRLKPEMFTRGTLKSRTDASGSELLIPKSAVLWTGKRSLVYTRISGRSMPTYHQREVELGPQADNFYIVKSGLREGEEIVSNGVFKIDAAAQLSGISSMMNPAGSVPGMSGEHQHGLSQMDKKDSSPELNLKTESFWVGGNCSMCQDRIEKAAMSLSGVQQASWGIESKQVEVTYHPEKINLMKIHAVIAAVGHNTEKVKAPDDVYQQLPACCLYRPEDKDN